jgi:hypothetical protein
MTPPDLSTHLSHAPATRFFLAFWGGLAVVDVARAGQAPPGVQVAVLAALAGACSVGQRAVSAVAVAGVVWLIVLGFVVNLTGELAITGPGDGWRLALLVVSALAGTTLRVSR